MANLDLKQIGERIQKRRKLLGFTQESFAEAMGVSIQMVSNLERGNKQIRIGNLIRLCEILQVSADYILTGETTAEDCGRIADDLSKLSERDREIIGHLISYCRQSDEK